MTRRFAEDLVVGREYMVKFDDCCIDGYFYGRVSGLKVDAFGVLDEISFDNTVTLHTWDQVLFEELTS